MRKILIASHGHLASGIRSSIEILTGKQDSVVAVDAYVDERDYRDDIKSFIESVGEDDEGVIFTDVIGGSVFQNVVLLQPERRGIIHVTGVNLPAVIQVLLTAEPLTRSSVEQLISEAREYLVCVDPLTEDAAAFQQEQGEDDFFD